MIEPLPETVRLQRLQTQFITAFSSLDEAKAATTLGPEENFRCVSVKIQGGLANYRIAKNRGEIQVFKDQDISAYELTEARRRAVQAEGERALMRIETLDLPKLHINQ